MSLLSVIWAFAPIYGDRAMGQMTEELLFNLQHGKGIFVCSKAHRLVLWPFEPPFQWVSRDVLPGVKWLGHKGNFLPLPSAEVKNTWSHTSTLPIRLHCVHISYT